MRRGNNGPGWIYFALSERTGLVKVGYSTNVPQRMHDLSQLFKTKIQLLHTVRTRFCVADEKLFHSWLSELRVGGEWFAIQSQEIQMACGLFADLETSRAEDKAQRRAKLMARSLGIDFETMVGVEEEQEQETA